jgi:phage terminase large subunit-like protein
VVEVNQGGDLIADVLRSVDKTLPVLTVRARRGKMLRAEPVAALYEQGRVWHAQRFRQLEDEMCDFTAQGLTNGRSPERLDAFVWALTELMLTRRAAPKVRPLG